MPVLITLLIALLTIPHTVYGISKEIVRGRSICDSTETVCIDGSITWFKNRKMITIEGQLKRPVEPGKLLFMFSGHLSSGEQVFHTKEVNIRGKRGEFIDERFKPPYSNRTIWALHQFTYRPMPDAEK